MMNSPYKFTNSLDFFRPLRHFHLVFKITKERNTVQTQDRFLQG